MDLKNIVKTAVLSFLTASVSSSFAATPASTADDKMEKCYGIVKAGMNDCQTATQSCAGSATKDKQPDAFLFLPKGTCNKIVGAKTEK